MSDVLTFPSPVMAHALSDLQQAAHRAAQEVCANPSVADEYALAKAKDAAHTANALVEMLEDALKPDVPA